MKGRKGRKKGEEWKKMGSERREGQRYGGKKGESRKREGKERD